MEKVMPSGTIRAPNGNGCAGRTGNPAITVVGRSSIRQLSVVDVMAWPSFSRDSSSGQRLQSVLHRVRDGEELQEAGGGEHAAHLLGQAGQRDLDRLPPPPPGPPGPPPPPPPGHGGGAAHGA